MQNDLMIPNRADVPAYIMSAEAARIANEEAAAGISTGYPARVKLSAGRFVLVDGNGVETPYPASKLYTGPDENQYLPVIILRAKKAFSKVWFAGAYNPTEEGKAPDCFSGDGERPSILSLAPQCDTCAACPHNAFGSGKDQAGNAIKGKACSDNKILAVFVAPNFGVHSFKVPPGSLKNFGLYVKQLSGAGISLSTVKTLIGFDPTVSTSILVFKFGGYIPETALPKLAELSKSLEVEEIIQGTTVAPPAAAPALPPPVRTPPPPSSSSLSAEEQAMANELGITVTDADLAEAKAAIAAEEEEARKKAEAAAKKKAAAAAKKKAEAEAAARAAEEAAKTVAAGKSQAEFEFDMEMNGSTPAPSVPSASVGGDVTDDDLSLVLGL